MRRLRTAAGEPPYRVIAKGVNRPHQTVHDAFAKSSYKQHNGLPPLDLAIAIATHLGGDEKEWREWWQDAATPATEPPPPPRLSWWKRRAAIVGTVAVLVTVGGAITAATLRSRGSGRRGDVLDPADSARSCNITRLG
ncbi:hypothetical protein FKR81_20700 [Lentzea tibetensis]|uniref:Uncharacterized protein n=1 Tax=Lentzea tibetensis TaxID=2591470 RepID=A0A563EST1_9PSEU|nr:hypothetical protein [Lentzea tibetensis]TWP50588.1 hypothetical protein FKR81_20700 [Lentzea tibetensis]